ncbi:MAG: 50S ribosomal protein L22 [Parcubacteria group bacterium]|nr:50S ribosomal protein L22 [Parcubacteria group bacterium]
MPQAISRATLRYLHIAPRKTRLVASLLKGKSVSVAEAELRYSTKKAAKPILKLLRSVIANAKAASFEPEKLYIVDLRVDQGPMSKRFMPRASGRAVTIQKKTSHIYITVAEKKTGTQKFREFYKPQSKKEAKRLVRDFEKEKNKKGELKKEVATETQGVIKKMFRRKSV